MGHRHSTDSEGSHRVRVERVELKDFGTSFRINIFRKSFETDPFGVVQPQANDAEHRSMASNEAERDAEKTGSASNEAQKEVLTALLVTLPEKSRTRAGMILDCMIRNPHITAIQIGKELGLSKATVQRAIDRMKVAGIVARQGSNNGGQWVIRGSK